jgi:hypothetical protein
MLVVYRKEMATALGPRRVGVPFSRWQGEKSEFFVTAGVGTTLYR